MLTTKTGRIYYLLPQTSYTKALDPSLPYEFTFEAGASIGPYRDVIITNLIQQLVILHDDKINYIQTFVYRGNRYVLYGDERNLHICKENEFTEEL